MFNFLVFIFTLSILILVHELGHFWAAKKAGIKVEEFGLGYPPRVWFKKIGETIYSLNAIPFGGFVRLYGEELADVAKKDNKRTFWAKGKISRMMVIIAGVLGNFLLAIFCFAVVYSVMGIPTATDKVTVTGVALGSPAAEAGLKEGDLILKIDDQSVTDLNQFVAIVGDKKGQETSLLLQRDQSYLTFLVTPRTDSPEGEGALGVVVSAMEMKKYPWWQMPVRGVIEGFKEAIAWGALIFSSLVKMVVDLVSHGVVPKDVAGPVGIFQLTASAAQKGFLTVLQFVGIFSVNLAILNIMPFPALDGGRLLFIVYEAVARRRPKPQIEHWVNLAGMVVLMSLLVLVTVNDVSRLLQSVSWPF